MQQYEVPKYLVMIYYWAAVDKREKSLTISKQPFIPFDDSLTLMSSRTDSSNSYPCILASRLNTCTCDQVIDIGNDETVQLVLPWPLTISASKDLPHYCIRVSPCAWNM